MSTASGRNGENVRVLPVSRMRWMWWARGWGTKELMEKRRRGNNFRLLFIIRHLVEIR